MAILLVVHIAAPVWAAEDPVELAREKILECYATGEESVDLSDYSLSKAQMESLYNDMYYSNQLPWYANNYQYSYIESTGKVKAFTPKFLDENEYDRNLYERRVAEILAETVFPGMTQLEIALSVHDYLAVNAQYDETKTYYEGYDLLVRGTAVCNGYAEAYMDLLKRAGVECTYVVSEIMDHGWNQVKLGDDWYHVDVTWDDPSQDRQGNVEHTYFLLSDEAIGSLEKPHFAYEALHKSTDKTYDGEDFWDAAVGQVCFESADVYYFHKTVDNNHFICRQSKEEGRVLYQYDNGVTSGNTIYRYTTRGLSMAGDRLYFCDGEKVSSIAKDGTDLREEHKEPFAADYGILGCQLVGDTLRLTTWDLQGNFSYKTVELDNVEIHTHTYEKSQFVGSCDQRGGDQYTCNCGVTYKVEDATASGHDYETTGKQARGLFEPGWETQECRRCGDIVTTTSFPYLSEEFLSDWDNLRWILVGAGILVIILINAGKKK